MAGTDRIEPSATLETSAGAPAELALHFMLSDKLRWVHGHVQEPVDLLITDVRMHRAEVRSLSGDSESFRHRIDRRPDHRMIDRLRHALAHEVNAHAAPAQ
jgi:hypothetical protein